MTKDKSLAWHQVRHDQKRAIFRIKRAFDVTLINGPGYLEIQVAKAGDAELLLPELCIYVRHTLERKAKDMGWQNFHLAFKCTCSQTTNVHLMKVDSLALQPKQAECLYVPLDQLLSKDKHLIWFVSED